MNEKYCKSAGYVVNTMKKLKGRGRQKRYKNINETTEKVMRDLLKAELSHYFSV